MNTICNTDVLSVPIIEDIKAGTAVNFSGGIAKTEKILGICEVDTNAGDVAPVRVLGTCIVTVGANVVKGDKLVANAEGKMIKATNEEYYEGYALDDGSETVTMIRGI
ncbi:MAG: DUF2190 family protein [Spirochaetales bacterium]|nr:DUF2190 family protein [Spirochaetales bacterium]